MPRPDNKTLLTAKAQSALADRAAAIIAALPAEYAAQAFDKLADHFSGFGQCALEDVADDIRRDAGISTCSDCTGTGYYLSDPGPAPRKIACACSLGEAA